MITAGGIKKKLNTRLPGGVMLFSLVISFLVLLTVSSIISINYFYTIRYEYNVQLQKLNDNVESAVLLAISGNYTQETNENDLLDLYGNGRDTVHLKRWNYGLLDGFEVRGNYKNIFMQRKALTSFEAGENPVFYIADHDREIAMAGAVELHGKVHLPKAGYRSTSLGGSFLSGNPINGTRLKSEQELPKLNTSIEIKIQQILSDNNSTDSVVNPAAFFEPDSISNSFSNKTVHVFVPGNLRLRNKIISGNIIIQSNGKIIIENSCVINDAIITGSVIEFEKACNFSGQVFATDSISSGEDCVFNYPTIMVVSQQKNSPAHINLGKNTLFTGTIIGLRDKQTINVPFNLRVQDNTIINGQIYFPGPSALAGELNGEFYFDHVITHTSSSVNDNFLFNVKVNKDKLHPNICFPGLIEDGKNRKPGILKWI